MLRDADKRTASIAVSFAEEVSRVRARNCAAVKYASLSGPAMGFHRLWIGAFVLLIVLRLGRWRITRETLHWAAPAGVIFGANLLRFVV